VHRRLIAAFIVVALVAALAFQLVINLLLPLFPRLNDLTILPPGTFSFLYKRSLPHGGGPQATPFLVMVLCLAVLSLLAVITAVAFAASRPVLQPVRRLARAAQRMSGGDLSVRIQPRGRDEVAQLVTSFNEMAAALEDKVGDLEQLEARARQFAGDVSHELRTPLTAMTAVVDILHEHPGLTGDAAAAAGLTAVANAVSQCLRARGWSSVSTDVPAGLTARLDRRRFDVILANLVGNALRHGGPPVTVTARIQSGDQGGQLAVEVRDHGDGLPPAAIPHIFDRFYKADTARARSGGSGLGLAIAWENARLHGGHIHAGNHPDGGAVFTVSIPVNGPGSR
jgi:two-component system sensor histidine kinase MtrB